MNKRLIGLLLLSGVSMGLGGCEPTKAPLVSPQQQRLGDMTANGVEVIQQGSRLQLILPTDQFFESQTTQVKEEQVYTLQSVAGYLKGYAQTHRVNYPIKIRGFTDTVYMHQARSNLSTQYAQVIAAFMWRHGFSPETMSVVGYGAHYPIGNNQTPVGSAYNRRVLIQVN